MDSINSLFSSLTLSLLKWLAFGTLSQLFQLFFLYCAVADFVAGILRGLNFVYWKYFSSFKYLFAILALILHRNITVDFGYYPAINLVIFYLSCSYIAVYLVDFSWLFGKETLDNQTKPNWIIAVVTLSAVCCLVYSKTFLFTHLDWKFVIYVSAIFIASLVRKQGRFAAGLMVVLLSLVQRLSIQMWDSHWMITIALQAALLAIAYDRQGKDAGVNPNGNGDYPAVVYVFSGLVKLYCYFLIQNKMEYSEYIVGMIYLQTILAASE